MKKLINLALGILLLLVSTSLFAEQKLNKKSKKLMRSAKVYYKQKNIDKATEIINPALESQPNNIELLYFVGEMHYYMATKGDGDVDEEYNKSKDFFLKALDQNEKPENEPKGKKEKKERVKILYKIYSSLVNIPLFYSNNAINESKNDQHKTAFENANQSLKYLNIFKIPEDKNYAKLNTTYSKVKNNSLAVLLSSAQKSDDNNLFIKALSIRAESDSTNADFSSALATEYYKNKDYENAIKWYKKATEIDENEINYTNLAIAYSRAEMLEEEKKCFEKVLTINPDNIDAINYFIELNLYKKKDYKAALEFGEKAVKINPNVTNYEYCASAAYLLKDYNKTIEYSLRWAELAPDNSKIYRLLFKSYKAKGDSVNEKKYLDLLKTKI